MSGGFFGAVIDTIGVEIEGIGLPQESVGDLVTAPIHSRFGEIARKFSITRDASTEFNASVIRTSAGAVLVSNHTREMAETMGGLRLGGKRMGYEIVTVPLTIKELEQVIYPVMYQLVQAGDFLSDRAAIHFHVGFPNNLRMLKNFLRISLMLDPVLFRLGGMGGTFRGHINLAAYSRPLMNSTAVNVNGRTAGKRFARITNPKFAITAKTLEEFWAGFGVKYMMGGGSAKYHPCRYSGINFYSVPQHGTVEFRHFNQSHDAFLVVAIGKFLRGIAELATLMTPSEVSGLEIVPSNDEISMSDASQILGKFYSLCQEKEIENLPGDAEMESILTTLNNSHFESIPALPVLTHIRDGNNTIPMETALAGNLEFFSEVLPPQYCDIHNITYRSIFDGVELDGVSENTPSENSPEPVHVEMEEEEYYDDEEHESDEENEDD